MVRKFSYKRLAFMAPTNGPLTGVVDRLNIEGQDGWQVIHVQHFNQTQIKYTLMKEIENA